MRRTSAIVSAVVVVCLASAGTAAAGAVPSEPAGPVVSTGTAASTGSTSGGVTRADGTPRRVMFVGNNWDGTADVVDARTFQRLQRIDVIPDKDERMADIYTHPDKLAYFLAIQQEVGEGHNQYVDDMFSTHDGRLVAVSRPSFADVVGIDLATGKIRWRFPMDGYRSDHMAISPNGRRILVSDSTANVVHELDIATGKETRTFPSGDSPHESNYSKDGSLSCQASSGRVYTPTDRPEVGVVRDTSKGDRRFQIVDNKTFRIVKKWDIGKKLAQAGYPGMSSAVRPMAIAPDERYAYLQVSFFHGFVEFDMKKGKVRRVAQLPDRTDGMPREQYLLDSAHHGLAINAAGTKLCAAGTMDDYAAVVNRRTFRYKILDVGSRPYWATNGPGGGRCWVSVSGDDKVVVIGYRRAKRLATIRVGDHPQRVRPGYVAEDIVSAWSRK
jgi:DNA-binding beta-propeller fold protein YncE